MNTDSTGISTGFSSIGTFGVGSKTIGMGVIGLLYNRKNVLLKDFIQ